MNKLWLLLLIPILLTGFACVSDDGGAAANPLSAQIAALTAKDSSLQSTLDTLRSELSQKASKSEIDDVNRKINNLPQSGGSAPADMATKSIVDQKIADAISALKADQAWIKSTGGSTGGGSTTDPRGDILASNGDLELYLEKDMDEELYIEDGQAKSFFMSIKNKGTAGTYYRLNANFDLAGDVSTIALIEPTTLSCENSSMVTFSRSTTIPATVSGLAWVSSAGGGGSKIWIGKNSTVDLILVVKINYTDPAVSGKLWTWDFSIRQIN
jgi:outer membrane murein-binding lipoprotein Lpp